MYIFYILRKKISRFPEIWKLCTLLRDVASKYTVIFIVTVGTVGKPFQKSDILQYVKEALYPPTATVTIQTPKTAPFQRGSG